MIKFLAPLFAAILLQATCPAQTVLLSEDFSSEVLPSGWSNDSMGNPATYLWAFDNPGGRTIFGAGFDTSFVILDSDHDGPLQSQNASLTTGAVSAAGADSLVLSIDEQFYTQGSGGSSHKIEASGDSGATWITIDSSDAVTGYPIAVRNSYDLSALAGSTNVMVRFTYAATWDYWWAIDNISLTGYGPCSAPPEAGQAQSSNAVACSGADFMLSLSGADVASGISYQWQSSPDSLTWTDISGATSATLTISQQAATYYRAWLSCSSQSDSSGIVFVDASSLCYCTPQTPPCAGINYIFGVSIDGTTLANYDACHENDSGYAYSSFPASGSATASLNQGLTYNFNVYSTGTNIIALWIDYDRSGTFDSTEYSLVSLFSGYQSVKSITIPDSIQIGLTGMRIRTRASGNSNGPGDACTAFPSGETEDYYIYIDSMVTGTHDLEHDFVSVYPNPASDFVKVSLKQTHEKVRLTMFNMVGAIVKDNTVRSHDAEISVADLPPGFYLLKIESGTRSTVKKVVVAR